MSKMRIVSLPIWKQQLAARILKARENDENVTLDGLKQEFSSSSISHKDIEELYQTRYLTYYIDDMNEEDFEIDPIGEEVQKNIDNTRMWKAVASLPSPHREVIARIYGLEDGTEQSTAKVSKALRVPKEDLDKLKKEGLEMLKKIMVR
jgi:DNA-directed RNA polymerase specialized sigma24 family protein